MRYFNFTRLVNKYSSKFTAITLKAGYYDDSGDWKDAETGEITLQGAIIKHHDSKIYKSNGMLTAHDRRLFTLEQIDKSLQGSQVVYEDNVYSIQDELENAKFTGVYSYTLKYVSAFKKKLQGDLNNEAERLAKRLDGVTDD